jgi:hypothetical protein
MPVVEYPRQGWRIRGVAAVTALALAVGFAWGAVTIVRQDRVFLQMRTPPGRSATVDWYLRSAGMAASDELLRGVALARLPTDADVAYVAPVSGRLRQSYWQTYFLTGYLLSPRRVWAIAWCEPPASVEACEPFSAVTDLPAAVAARGARHLVVAGHDEVPLTYTRAHRLSSSLTLLDLP